MAHILVTLLGDPRIKADGSYPETIYQFEDGDKSSLTSYTSLAIKEKFNLDKIVVLGTTKSAWHLFVKYCFMKAGEIKDQASINTLLAHLESDYSEDSVQQSDLDEAANLLNAYDDQNCDYELRLVPYGHNRSEQTQTLKIMMDCFDNRHEEQEATLDVSYGLRHLPMLMQQSALLLQSLRGVKINNIFYGAFHIAKGNVTPMMALGGMLEIDHWTKAFHQYEQDGNYAAFKEPLKHEGIKQEGLDALQEASYCERTFNLAKASEKLDKVKEHLPSEFTGVSSFFTYRFKQHITWADKTDLQKQQGKLAHFYLKNGDFVRACIFALESFITSILERPELPKQQNHEIRDKAVKDFRSSNPISRFRQSKKGLKPDYSRLNDIRNTLAHGTEPKADIVKLMENPIDLQKELERLFNKLGIKP